MEKLEKFVESRNHSCLVKHNRAPYSLTGEIVYLNGWAYLGFDCPYSEEQREAAGAACRKKWGYSPEIGKGETEEEFLVRTCRFWKGTGSMNKPIPSTRAKEYARAKAYARPETSGMACGDYRALASALYEALREGVAEGCTSGLDESDIQGMPDGDNSPLQFLAWWTKDGDV